MYAVVNLLLNEVLTVSLATMSYEEMYEAYFNSIEEGEEVLSYAEVVEALS